jgi:hypothetical protein
MAAAPVVMFFGAVFLALLFFQFLIAFAGLPVIHTLLARVLPFLFDQSIHIDHIVLWNTAKRVLLGFGICSALFPIILQKFPFLRVSWSLKQKHVYMLVTILVAWIAGFVGWAGIAMRAPGAESFAVGEVLALSLIFAALTVLFGYCYLWLGLALSMLAKPFHDPAGYLDRIPKQHRYAKKR